jgi:hypothetical protein
MVDIHVLVVYRRFRTRIAPSLNFTHTFPLCSLFPLEYSLTHSLTHSFTHLHITAPWSLLRSIRPRPSPKRYLTTYLHT